MNKICCEVISNPILKVNFFIMQGTYAYLHPLDKGCLKLWTYIDDHVSWERRNISSWICIQLCSWLVIDLVSRYYVLEFLIFPSYLCYALHSLFSQCIMKIPPAYQDDPLWFSSFWRVDHPSNVNSLFSHPQNPYLITLSPIVVTGHHLNLFFLSDSTVELITLNYFLWPPLATHPFLWPRHYVIELSFPTFCLILLVNLIWPLLSLSRNSTVGQHWLD